TKISLPTRAAVTSPRASGSGAPFFHFAVEPAAIAGKRTRAASSVAAGRMRNMVRAGRYRDGNRWRVPHLPSGTLVRSPGSRGWMRKPRSSCAQPDHAVRKTLRMSHTYPPISDYALLSACHSGALVSKDGSIDWCAFHRFEARPVFGRLLDWERGGFFRIAPVGEYEVTRKYVPNTNVLETRFENADGRF